MRSKQDNDCVWCWSMWMEESFSSICHVRKYSGRIGPDFTEPKSSPPLATFMNRASFIETLRYDSLNYCERRTCTVKRVQLHFLFWVELCPPSGKVHYSTIVGYNNRVYKKTLNDLKKNNNRVINQSIVRFLLWHGRIWTSWQRRRMAK